MTATEADVTNADEWEDGLIGTWPGDHDVWTAPDGSVRYRLTIDLDQDCSINDYETDGKVSDYVSWDHGHESRPDGFTGRAMKIEVDRSGFVWWEPYNDLYGWKEGDVWQSGLWEQLPADVRAKEKNRIQDLLQRGFVGVTVDRQTRCDQGHWHTQEGASLGGIDSLENGYLAEVVQELIGELTP